MRNEPLIGIKLRTWFVEKPETHIKDASPIDLSYLAALIDGEGNLDIMGTQPRIRVGMKSLEPLKFAKNALAVIGIPV